MTPLDLSTLDSASIHPAAYYALCGEARERGIVVALDDPRSPTTVEELVALVQADREKHDLRDALREALRPLGITNPEWVETIDGNTPYESWTGAHVALAVEIEEVGGPESGPSISMYPSQWVNVARHDHAYEFVFCAVTEAHSGGDTPQHSVRVDAESPAQVAETLVGILRACGYESLS